MITKIKKRDGSVVHFDLFKIQNAIVKAVDVTEEFDKKISKILAEKVLNILVYKFKNKIPSVEDIQDTVETILIAENYPKTAKAYILYREEHAKIRERQKEILHGFTTKLPFTDNALIVIAERYLKRDGKTGEIIESPDGMFERTARTLANAEKAYGASKEKLEKYYREFLSVLENFEFTPAGRTLANVGSDTPLVANCIVLHIDDSMSGIFQTLKDASLLQQAGSGLGFPFHLLRPAGMRAVRSKGIASGPVSFLRVYNEAFGIIKQQGRHGANMAVMSVEHPDILDFIHCKEIEGEIRNFNISVGITDRFMKEIENDSNDPWICEFNGQKMPLHKITRDKYGTVIDVIPITMTAKEIFQEIVSCAWGNGEPGIIFLDTVNKFNSVPGLGRIEACNPCGEQFLHDGDVCNLGSINLEKFEKNHKLDEKKLEKVVRIAVRMLDNVVDLSDFPVERVNNTFRGNRRLGLGVMGFADLLYLLGIPYNSEEGFKMGEHVMKIINETAHDESQKLAKEKGVFPNFKLSIYADKKIKMRNAALTTVAPTGTISMVFDVASGMEPYFALVYYKQVMGGKNLYYVNKHLERVLKERGIYSEELITKISETGSVQNMKEIPKDIRDTFVVAMDISAEDHIRMQAAFQKYTDNAISKTCNFPHDATQTEVMKGYLLAWKLGCKGVTVYRNGSREEQVLNLVSKDVKKEPSDSGYSDICPECGGKLEIKEGCATCASCAYSYCSI